MEQLISISNEELKQLQIKSLEIADYVVNLCKDHDIRAFLYAGSLLGAVRHKGFIPWDDDIDIMLPAPDYNRFLEIWEKFGDKERYSLCVQSKTYNDHTLSGSVRDNNTTFITDSTVDLDVNQGLAIDIGTLHACPKTGIGQKVQLVLAAARSLFKAGRIPVRQKKLIKAVSKLILGIFRSPDSQYYMWSRLERFASISDKHYEKAQYVREFSMFPFIKWLFPKEWFERIMWVPFEDKMMPVPNGAHEYLTKRYGNYMEYPPEKDRHPEHRIVFMDLDTPYKEYRGVRYYKQEKR